MKKKVIGVILGVVVLLGLGSCLLGEDEDTEYAQVEDDDEEDEEEKEEKQSGEGDSNVTATPLSADLTRGMELSVNGQSGELSITRFDSFHGEAVEDGIWTIFVYLCGTDLESFYGMATGDMEEMLSVDGADNVRYIVQTGGTQAWYNDEVDSNATQRFLLQDGYMELVDEQSLAGMGDSATLTDFLTWGTENYPSEHSGLIFWDHGGGSITGVCFDEMSDYDSLSLLEIDQALYSASQNMGQKFDFIGFDACLMGTVETATILATYADYMYGSEETEPGSGWDYNAITEFLYDHPEAGGKELGEVVCDSFLRACEEQDDDDLTTLSVIDLAMVDSLLTSFNDVAYDMYNAGEDNAQRADIVRAIESADNFGGNNKTEGYTNMVDLGGIIDACSEYSTAANSARSALDDAVVYSVSGRTHTDASGLSMYYPLSVQGSSELATFSEICISPYYLSFVDRQNHNGAAGQESEYDNSEFFNEDGDWDQEATLDDGYWDYLDDYEQTGESPYITFDVEPALDEEGSYWFALDENGYNNAADVYALVYEFSADGEDLIELGETIDVLGDWESGVFYDYFDGYWISLPDGQNLATYIVDQTEEYVMYTSPIYLNGEETNLRIKQYFESGEIEIEGTWDGIDENGMAGRDVYQLQEGDVIVPAYYAFSIETDDEFEYTGIEYVVEGDGTIYYDIMESSDYLYAFNIDDIYGDYYLTDPVMFYVDESGEVSFYTE